MPFCCKCCWRSEKNRTLSSVVEDDVQQRAVNAQFAVVLNEPKLAKAVHEEADARARGADHLRQNFLAYFGNHRLRCAFLAKLSEQQQSAGQTFSLELKRWSTRS